MHLISSSTVQGLTYGDPLCVDGAQISVLKQVHHEVLSGLQGSKQASMVRNYVVHQKWLLAIPSGDQLVHGQGCVSEASFLMLPWSVIRTLLTASRRFETVRADPVACPVV